MKNMFTVLLLSGLLFSLPIRTSAQDYDKILGDWTYNTPDAEYGYHTGTITFTEEESEIKGEVEFAAGYKVKLEELEMEGKELNFGLYIDYEHFKVRMSLEDGKLTGTVEFSGGVLDITAEKE
jgi:hypothetical protein